MPQFPLLSRRGLLRGRLVRHETVEVDGSATAVRQALQAAVADPACVALFDPRRRSRGYVTRTMLTAGGRGRLARSAAVLPAPARRARMLF